MNKPACYLKGRKTGISLNEYAVILAFMALGTIASLNLLGLSVNELVYNLGHSMAQALGLVEPEKPVLTLSDWTGYPSGGTGGTTAQTSNSGRDTASGNLAGHGGNVRAAGGSTMGGRNGTLLGRTSGTIHNTGINTLLPPWLNGVLGHSDKTAPPVGNNPAILPGGGYYTIKTDSKGQPALRLTDGFSLGATNVTSVEGLQMNSLGAIQMASQLQALAFGQTNPGFSSYYRAVSSAAYYLGGATGMLDNLPELARPTIRPNLSGQRRYTNGDALRDVNRYKNQLLALLQNPPEGLPSADYLQLLTMGVNAYNIGQNYVNHFSRFIDTEGYVSHNFVDPAYCQATDDSACLIGNGLAGSALERAEMAAFSSQMPPLSGMVYGDIVNTQKLQTISTQLLQDKVAVTLGIPAGVMASDAVSSTPDALKAGTRLASVAPVSALVDNPSEDATTPSSQSQDGDGTEGNTNFVALFAGFSLTIVGGLAWQKYGSGKTS